MFSYSRRIVSSSAVRNFATGKTFSPRSARQIWMGDAGAYPVMAVIGGAVLFAFSFSSWFLLTNPDSQIGKLNRKSTMRGIEYAGQNVASH